MQQILQLFWQGYNILLQLYNLLRLYNIVQDFLELRAPVTYRSNDTDSSGVRLLCVNDSLANINSKVNIWKRLINLGLVGKAYGMTLPLPVGACSEAWRANLGADSQISYYSSYYICALPLVIAIYCSFNN